MIFKFYENFKKFTKFYINLWNFIRITNLISNENFIKIENFMKFMKSYGIGNFMNNENCKNCAYLY